MRIFCGMATAGNNIFCIMGSWDAKTGKNSSDISARKSSTALMLEVKVLLSLQLVVLIPFLGYGILVNQALSILVSHFLDFGLQVA
ncbi:hypothetical protein CMV_008218 [Castanea mollissima]|uniref:Uncharacterized protein n=1 Tax=Castanea mollissima TaxID=60419 RepID=A0A8J4RCL5_9ROSI|nr:hypothetical protein CMV_008218 [Castanea mollissima]